MASDNVAALIAIVGPTGTGKSELSLQLAERLGDAGTPAEIVNADAMQLYRGMDIGTAKLTPAERRGIPHHMLDVLEVTDESTVAAYQRDARAAIDGIRARSALPILVGGSGLYVSSVLYDLRFPGTDPSVRHRIEAELERLGADAMFHRLEGLDPAAAASIDPRNARRLVRALEVIELTGEPFSANLPGEPAVWMPATVIGLRSPRQELTARLDTRVSSMWQHGLVDEVRSLIPKGIERGVTASRAIGYAQALAQIGGTATEEEAVSHTQQLTRRYARRQMSWFNRYPSITWFDAHAPGLADRMAGAQGCE